MGERKHDDPSAVTASHHDILTSVFGSKDEARNSVVYSYKHGFSGFAAMLTESQAETLAKFPEVISVKPSTYHGMHTTRSWDFLGLDYNLQPSQPQGLLQKAKYGEDAIIGVIDSGIWPESRSFDDAGYSPVPARWKGVCQDGRDWNATSCNRKIIGARWYIGGVSDEVLKRNYMSSRDLSGHGTHVASTIAGGQVFNVSYRGGGLGGGVAPRSRLAVYKVCWEGAGCDEAAILAAIDDAIDDGVDVLSLSLGGGAGQEIFGSLHAVLRGVSVIFSGGNDGPVASTVNNALPWVTTVAASTMDRSFPTMITLGNREKLVGQSLHYNASVISNDFKVLDYASSCDVQTLASSNVTGKIVLCYAPGEASIKPAPVALSDAIKLTVEAGGNGLIFAQNAANSVNGLNVCEGIMPCVLVDFEIAHRIASYSTRTGNPVVKVSPTVTVVGNGVLAPRVATFSSRGPSVAFPAILKPDVAAPGVGILAAIGDSYVLLSGTSMACPHVSAVTALIKSVHRDWSPAMIKSAIVTTSSLTDRFGMPIQAEGVPRKLADPFDFGGGHMNPERAVDPGLVYDVDAREYNKFFNCTLGLVDDCESYQLNLNLPSIAVPNLKDNVTVVRTVTNVGPVEATYQAVFEAPAGVIMLVEPSVISFTKGGDNSTAFRVTLTTKERVQGGYTFGSLTWSDGSTHSVRIPVVVRTVIQDFVADTS